MHVLVTRPKGHGEALADKIRILGGEATGFPTLEIHPASQDLQSKFVSALESANYCFVVSPGAASSLVPSLVEQLIARQSKGRNAFHLISMGPTTTRILEERGLTVTFTPPSGTVSETLLEFPLFQKEALDNATCALITGLGGRKVIQEILEARGAKVAVCVVYERKCPRVDADSALAAWKMSHVDVVLVTSQSSLDNLCDLIGQAGKDWLNQQTLVVVSRRLADYAKSLGFENLVLAKSAEDESIIQVLKTDRSIK